MKKVVVASDSFKGCLSSAQVADAVGKPLVAICRVCRDAWVELTLLDLILDKEHVVGLIHITYVPTLEAEAV